MSISLISVLEAVKGAGVAVEVDNEEVVPAATAGATTDEDTDDDDVERALNGTPDVVVVTADGRDCAVDKGTDDKVDERAAVTAAVLDNDADDGNDDDVEASPRRGCGRICT
jgi:hypothetical protein